MQLLRVDSVSLLGPDLWLFPQPPYGSGTCLFCFCNFSVCLSRHPAYSNPNKQVSIISDIQLQIPRLVAQAEGGWEIRQVDCTFIPFCHYAVCGCLCVSVYVCLYVVGAQALRCTRGNQRTTWGELVPSCHCVGSRRLTWAVRLCSRHLYSISPSCQPCPQISTSLAK